MKKDTRKLITCIAVPLATGAVSGFFTRNGMKVFAKLNKPPLSPPGWLFPVVWTILFIMMAVPCCMDDPFYHDGNCFFPDRIQTKKQRQGQGSCLVRDSACREFPVAVFLLWSGMVWFCVSLAYFFVGTCVRLHPYIREIFPERCVPDDPISGMADFCRLPESVYRTLELTELLSHTENVFCFYKSG